jgi:cyanophycinase
MRLWAKLWGKNLKHGFWKLPLINTWDSFMLELMKSHLAQLSMAISTRYPVMIIGGAEDKTGDCDILSAFFESAGGNSATIGIIPAASREPVIVGDRYYQIFKTMGAKQVQVLDIRHRQECDEARWLSVLEACTGVFVTGGDQVRLCDLLAGTQLVSHLQEKVSRGLLTLAGTSAGAAMMGEKMIAGGSSGESPNPGLVDLSEGLGIVPELLIDQHFHNRNRMARLLSAIAANPDKLGVGIDEDTCLAMLGDGTFKVLGKGVITIVDPGEALRLKAGHYAQKIASYSAEQSLEQPLTKGIADLALQDVTSHTEPLSLHNLKLHVLKQGDRYDYRKRTVF